MYLFFDTETTGKFDFKAAVEAPHQPRVVQIGAIVTDESGAVMGELNSLVKCDGWKIEEEAAAIHGITTERCDAFGLSIKGVLEILRRMAGPVKTVVAHNVNFDRNMLVRESHLLSVDYPFSGLQEFCTMEATTEILKLPGNYGYKWPKLQEAYKHFFGVEFEGAHDAMADIRATKDVFFKLQEVAKEAA